MVRKQSTINVRSDFFRSPHGSHNNGNNSVSPRCGGCAVATVGRHARPGEATFFSVSCEVLAPAADVAPGIEMATCNGGGTVVAPSPAPPFWWCSGVPREGAVLPLLAVDDCSSSESSGHCCSTLVRRSLRARSAICLWKDEVTGIVCFVLRRTRKCTSEGAGHPAHKKNCVVCIALLHELL